MSGIGVGIGLTPPSALPVAAGGPPPFDGGLIVDGNFPSPNVAWGLGTPDWAIADGAATSIEGLDGPMSEALLSPVTDTNTYNLDFDCLSNVEDGALLIQLFGATQQTIYNASPAVGAIPTINFAAVTANTHIRVRSIDGVPISITNLRLVAGEGV